MNSQVAEIPNLLQYTKGALRSELPLQKEFVKEAENALYTLDFPTTRHEKWKYTRLAKIKSLELHASANNQSTTWSDDFTIRIKDGEIQQLPTQNKVEIKLFSACKEEELALLGSLSPLKEDIFNAMNFLFQNKGVLIRVGRNQKISDSLRIEIENTEDKVLSCPRILVVLEEGSSLKMIQRISGKASASLSIPVAEYFVHRNAHLVVQKLQAFEGKSYLIQSDYCLQERDSSFTIHSDFVYGNFVRNNLQIQVKGENCVTNMYGLFCPQGKQHIDNQTLVDHQISHCVSNELYKGVVRDESSSVFNGKVVVRKDAQQINAFQSNANILLHEKGSINSKPELEIYANDVKCSHGCTTGQLDEEAVFYLRARGLSEESAKNMLVSAFIHDVLEKIEDIRYKEILISDLQRYHKFI